MRARERRRLEATAYHEAGHAVVRIDLGLRFKSVTIVPDGDCLGCVVAGDKAPKWFAPDVEITPRAKRWIERQVLIALAGPAAEAKFMGRRNHVGANGDYRSACDLAVYMYDGPLLGKYMAFMSERAKQHVGSFPAWTRIEHLAAALLDRRTLTGKDAAEVCRLALTPPAVDWRSFSIRVGSQA